MPFLPISAVFNLSSDDQAEKGGGPHPRVGPMFFPVTDALQRSPHDRFHCPVCSKFMAADEMEKHLLMCFSKTRLTYNKDILSRDSGECAICLEELEQGDTIARLPCLCIYHKGCIDEWFEVNRSCPEHPAD
uniref:RING-type E3 ubiquitin transferase n=1 Tax=Oryzias latipes TaxID=8090 RepID=A0A3B3HN40_ORYLA